MSSVAQTCEVINRVAFLVSPDELMQIDIRPQDALAPILDLAPAHNPALVYLASLSSGSHRTMLGALNLSAYILSSGRCDHATLPWWMLRKAHTNALRAWLAQNRSAATGNKILSAVRGALRAAWELEMMDSEAYHRAIAVKAIKGGQPDKAAGRALTPGEVVAILAACQADPTPAGPRDAAIFALGVFGGLRRAELAKLQIDNYDPTTQVLTVKGKGNKTRTVPLEAGTADALADWLYLRGDAPGALFCPVDKIGRITRQGITDQSIYDILDKRRIQANVKPFTPHDCRRTMAGDLLDTGADISTVQKLMGHASPTTTAGYDRRDQRTMKAAVNRRHAPYVRRY